jgi:hypothetical protein
MMVDDDEDDEEMPAVLLVTLDALPIFNLNSKQSLTNETEPVVAAKASTSANAKSSAPPESMLTRKTSKSRLVKLKKDTEVNSQKNQVLKKDIKDKLTLLRFILFVKKDDIAEEEVAVPAKPTLAEEDDDEEEEEESDEAEESNQMECDEVDNASTTNPPPAPVPVNVTCAVAAKKRRKKRVILRRTTMRDELD